MLHVPTESRSAEIVVKRSRFIATVHVVSSPQKARETIKQVRVEHPSANHVVHAFIVGDARSVFGLSDDGEPGGTAGRPALEVLKGSGLTDVLVTIVRYFGGTKLGTGGLVQAYTAAVQEALRDLATKEKVALCEARVALPYPLYERFKLLLEEHEGEVIAEEFGAEVALQVRVPERRTEALDRRLADLSAGKVKAPWEAVLEALD